MIRTNIDTNEIRDIFSTIGLANGNGKYYKERLRKHKQVFDYIVHLNKAIEKLSKKENLYLLIVHVVKAICLLLQTIILRKLKKRKLSLYVLIIMLM